MVGIDSASRLVATNAIVCFAADANCSIINGLCPSLTRLSRATFENHSEEGWDRGAFQAAANFAAVCG